ASTALLELDRDVYLSLGVNSPTIANSRPITSTAPRMNSARCPKGRTSTGATAAVKSSAAMTTASKPVWELPKVGKARRDQAVARYRPVGVSLDAVCVGLG